MKASLKTRALFLLLAVMFVGTAAMSAPPPYEGYCYFVQTQECYYDTGGYCYYGCSSYCNGDVSGEVWFCMRLQNDCCY